MWKLESTPGAGASSGPGLIRARWRTASLASGWRYPGDWAAPEVDLVCRAITATGDPGPVLADLGSARATAGVGLAETLTDLAALHAVLTRPDAVDGLVAPDPDTVPTRFTRLTALGWADAAIGPAVRTEAADPLTGLATPAYLRTRLREIYHQARAGAAGALPDYVLVVITPTIANVQRWPRAACMVLIADALRVVFRAGETLAVAGAAVALVLSPWDLGLPDRVESARRIAEQRLAADPAFRGAAAVRARLHTLPAKYAEARQFIAELGGR